MRRLSPARRERTALTPEVRPVTVPQIAPKEKRRVLGYASDD